MNITSRFDDKHLVVEYFSEYEENTVSATLDLSESPYTAKFVRIARFLKCPETLWEFYNQLVKTGIIADQDCVFRIEAEGAVFTASFVKGVLVMDGIPGIDVVVGRNVRLVFEVDEGAADRIPKHTVTTSTPGIFTANVKSTAFPAGGLRRAVNSASAIFSLARQTYPLLFKPTSSIRVRDNGNYSSIVEVTRCTPELFIPYTMYVYEGDVLALTARNCRFVGGTILADMYPSDSMKARAAAIGNRVAKILTVPEYLNSVASTSSSVEEKLNYLLQQNAPIGLGKKGSEAILLRYLVGLKSDLGLHVSAYFGGLDENSAIISMLECMTENEVMAVYARMSSSMAVLDDLTRRVQELM